MQKYKFLELGLIMLGAILITSGCYINMGIGNEPKQDASKEPVASEIPTQTKPAPSNGMDFSDAIPVHFCTTAQKAAKICNMLYSATCGWFNSKIKCIKYPCAQTYSNPCTACAADNVDRWSAGECPKS